MSYKHDIIKFRRGTASDWANSSPQPGGEVLNLGEPGYEKDTGKIKIGDGVTGWNDLEYVSAGIIVVEDIDHLINEVIQPGSGIVLNFNDSNDTLTISASGINNPANSRILTSDGTNTGIDAESNFTYDPSTGIALLQTDGINNRLRLNQASNTSSDHPRIILRRDNGSLNSPLPLTSGNFIGSIYFSTIDSSSNESTCAQILAYTDKGLSGYANLPTTLRISNRMVDGTFNHIYVFDDGTFNPRNGAIINDDAKSVAFGGSRASAVQIFNSATLNQDESSEGMLIWSFGDVSNNSTASNVIGSTSAAYMTIPSGVNNSAGVLIGHGINSHRNVFDTTYDDNGNLAQIIGANISYGHHVYGNNDEASSSFARGINISPFAGKGTITTAYDIYLGNTAYNAIIDSSGTIKYGDGTITNRYGIVQDSADPNVLNGSLTVNNGLSAPKKIQDLGTVSGNVSINYAIDKQIQTLTLDGTSTNLIEGSGWPALTSAEVLLEITVSSSTTVTWSIVDDWYSSIPSLASGKYLVLLRSMGSTMQGHYIGAKTN